MNAFEIWLLGQAVKGATQRAVAALFKHTLPRRVLTAAEQWRAKLPEGARLDALEALLPKARPRSLETPAPAPGQVLTKLEKSELPNANDWTEDLFQQWRWVRETIEEPQEFFLLPEEQARATLAELGGLLALECQKDRDLFQIEMLKRSAAQNQALSELLEKQEDTGNSNARLQAEVEHLTAIVGSVTAEKDPRTGDYHSDIDAAVAYTQQGQPDVALAQLKQLRQRHWDRLRQRERFRVVANIGHAYNAKDQYSEAARHFVECQQFQPEDEQARCLEAIGHGMLGDCERAFTLAAGISSDFPNSDLAHATRVRNAPNDMSFAEVEARVPMQVRAAVETASALCWRALHAGDSTSAESYARSALARDEKARQLIEQLGLVLFESGRKEAAAQWH